MKTQTSAFLLAGALLLAAALPTHAQHGVGDAANLNFETKQFDLPIYDLPLSKNICLPEDKQFTTSPFSSASIQSQLQAPTQVEQLQKTSLEAEYLIGILQTQIEILSRRLAILENAAPLAKTYSGGCP